MQNWACGCAMRSSGSSRPMSAWSGAASSAIRPTSRAPRGKMSRTRGSSPVSGPGSRPPLRWPALARRLHKWLALVVGIQAVLWMLGGLYMAAVHIDIIHGDRLVKAVPPRPLPVAGLVEPAHLAHLAPGLKSPRLEGQAGRPVYVVDAEAGRALFDARSGRKLSPLGEAEARARAKALFPG